MPDLRDILRRGARPLTALPVLAATAIAALAQGAVVEGQVFDDAGRPVPGVVVQVVAQQAGFLQRLTGKPPRATEVGRAVTDDSGLFRIELPSAPLHGRLFAWCGATGPWDGLRYERPAPRDITRDLRRGHASVVFRLPDAHAWAELRREIDRAGGPESARGRILRHHGLPPERVVGLDGREEWIYPGVTYVFSGGELVETRGGPAVVRARAGAEGR
ncbi:MAG: hypothetical protein D6718_01740 [Acidobacteria bacterium]|nr:MAG: hypothetical protein D6718_01740 [Acidobacteriota bacterium]